MNIETFTAQQILNIPLHSPEKLYSVDSEDELKKAYRKLAMKWHPDRQYAKNTNMGVDEIFSHIKVLYEKSLKLMELGEWKNHNVLTMKDIENTKYIMKFQKEEAFELGMQYISDNYCAWVFDAGNEDLINTGLKEMTSFRFKNDRMKEEIGKYLPVLKKVFDTKDKKVIVVEKDKDMLRLSDVLSYYKGKIDPKHVAWILSCLYNLACYLEVNKKMHGAITINNFFINPKKHSGALLGGWWFTHTQDEKLIALSQKAIDICPFKIMNSKKADTSLNLEMIRQIGRILLGDITGVHLSKDKEIPKQLLEWVRGSSGVNAFEEYKVWQEKVLKDSFGVRRFTKMDLIANDIYF